MWETRSDGAGERVEKSEGDVAVAIEGATLLKERAGNEGFP